MKIPNKKELQKIVPNHSSDIEFQGFVNLCKKCTAKPYFLFLIDATLTSDNSSRFTRNLLETIWKLIMKNDYTLNLSFLASTYVLSFFKNVVCNFILFIKTNQTIYNNYYVKNILPQGFWVFQKKKSIYKKKCGTVTKKSVKT